MKRILVIVLCIFILIITTGCNKNENDKNNIKENYKLGVTLDDGRLFSFEYNPKTSNDETLFNLISEKKLTIDDFLKDLDEIEVYKDGGSKLYKYKSNKKYGEKLFYVMICNSLDGIRNIYLSEYKNHVENKCIISYDNVEGVKMSIKENTLTNLSATIIIKDVTNNKNIYGEYFVIQEYKDDAWTNLNYIKENVTFNKIGYSVDKNNSLELKTNWENIYGKLRKGKYRIIKDFSYEGEGSNHHITAEFEIK